MLIFASSLALADRQASFVSLSEELPPKED